MSATTYPIHLTGVQLSHVIVAVQTYMDGLLHKANTEPEGGEHEEWLAAQGILTILKNAQAGSTLHP